MKGQAHPTEVKLQYTLTAQSPETDQTRKLLVGWNKELTKDSGAAALYVVWERRVNEGLAANRVPAAFAREYAGQATRLLVPRMTSPSADWFGANPAAGRDKLLLVALGAAVTEVKGLLGADMSQWKWGALHAATFRHPLATAPESRTLLNIGPIPRAGYALTPFSTGGRAFDQSNGSSYRHVMDLQSWDRSVATSAPGQSGQPGSPHYDDLAKLWGALEYFPLSFTESAVQRNTEATLTLTPGGQPSSAR